MNEELNLFQRLLAELSAGDIALWISIISFLMSFASWVRTFITEMNRLRFSIQSFHSKGSTAYMFLMIENRSRLPVAISQISLIIDGKSVNCEPFSKEVITGTKKVKKNTVETTPMCSAPLPIQIAGLSSMSCIVLFEDIPSEIPSLSTHLNFEVSTNRGRKAKTKLQLPAGWAGRTDIP